MENEANDLIVGLWNTWEETPITSDRPLLLSRIGYAANEISKCFLGIETALDSYMPRILILLESVKCDNKNYDTEVTLNTRLQIPFPALYFLEHRDDFGCRRGISVLMDEEFNLVLLEHTKKEEGDHIVAMLLSIDTRYFVVIAMHSWLDESSQLDDLDRMLRLISKLQQQELGVDFSKIPWILLWDSNQVQINPVLSPAIIELQNVGFSIVNPLHTPTWPADIEQFNKMAGKVDYPVIRRMIDIIGVRGAVEVLNVFLFNNSGLGGDHKGILSTLRF